MKINETVKYEIVNVVLERDIDFSSADTIFSTKDKLYISNKRLDEIAKLNGFIWCYRCNLLSDEQIFVNATFIKSIS